MDKPKIGITIGDINGIGLEVILKTLAIPQIINFCTPVVYGSTKVISYHKNIVGVDFHFNSIQRAERMPTDKINILNCWQENVNITLGKVTELGGQYALKSLECATKDLKQGLIDALVTAPIHKEAMKMAGFPYPGHTEYLTKELGVDESLMFMVADQLRVGLVTNHLPLKDVVGQITKERILKKIQIMETSLRVDFGVDRPTIAVLGLNPHASDGGVIGDEDDRVIRPAVIECKKNGLLVVGPFPADGFFGSGAYKKFDAILAMYHDQGLVPFKLLAFGGGINFTAGLPGVRTSPDHGTALDLAGKNEADPDSFREALFAAIDIARNRKDYYDSRANALTKRSKIAVESEEEEEEIDDLVEEAEEDDENE
ncbi:MAG: 4-hydroxythreonine-4-phosphate dehydrogenase PdxA [Haliscomenobacter sp.]|nr:4-hydroxythreonine-4-phosphate dehydrogenase PdxA [Haliscomenobacter sp.]MBK8877965.1 4-hydroxythreonine-4-phosphate dehydrogenase PdxA [Haliscomenobacter sp.]